jgi:hypothetical protein
MDARGGSNALTESNRVRHNRPRRDVLRPDSLMPCRSARRSRRSTPAGAIDHQVINGITREDRLHGDGMFWRLANGVGVPVPRAMQLVGRGNLDVQGGPVQCGRVHEEIRRSHTPDVYVSASQSAGRADICSG